MKLHIKLMVGFLIFFLLEVNHAHACSCAKIESLEKEFAGSDAVFVGTVMKMEAVHGRVSRFLNQLFNREMDDLYDLIITFRVTESFKGIGAPKEIEIVTPDPSVCCICGFEFQEGTQYLVFASGPRLVTSICDLTDSLPLAMTNVKDLRALVKNR
jgi:hypothetical protein